MMKTKHFFLFLAACFTFMACDNAEETISLEGTEWSYSKPHIDFEIKGDTLTIPTQPGQAATKISEDDFVRLFSKFANDKMSAYFKGVKFISNTAAEVSIVVNEMQQTLPISYSLKKDKMILDIDKFIPDGSGIPQGVIPNTFDFDYDTDEIEMYLSTNTCKIVGTAMLDKIIPLIYPGYAELPDQVKTMIKASMTQTIDSIEELEIGFVLKAKN